MKKVALLFVAVLFLAACHCERRTTGTPCRKASCQATQSTAKKQTVKKTTTAKKVQTVKKGTPAKTAETKAAEEAAAFNTIGTVQRQGNKLNVKFNEPIQFGHNSDNIETASYKQLDATANILKNNPNSKITVKGYSDSLGNPAYNVDLSQRRAQAVANALQKRGIAAENISAIGYGAANPIATNKTVAGRRANRRVELDIEIK